MVALVLSAPSPEEAERRLGAEAEALRQSLDRDMTLEEALDIQRRADELQALSGDLRRVRRLRRPEG